MTISSLTTIQAYRLNAGGVRARMAILRMVAADSVNNRNETTRLSPGDWRGARKSSMDRYETYYGCLDRCPAGWYSHFADNDFRDERDARSILGHRGAGWYTDAQGDETAIGIVCRLSHGRFIAGYHWTSNDERAYFAEVFTDESDAARMADEHARVFAESAREDDERFTAMSLDELDVECKQTEVEKAIALRHRAKFGGFDRVREAIAKLREARETLKVSTRAYEKGQS